MARRRLLGTLDNRSVDIFNSLDSPFIDIPGSLDAGGAVIVIPTINTIINEIINITETISNQLPLIKSIDENVNVTEAINSLLSDINKTIDENINITEIIASNVVFDINQSINEIVTITETIDSDLVSGINQSINEIVNITETIDNIVAVNKIIDENVNINEVIDTFVDILMIFEDTGKNQLYEDTSSPMGYEGKGFPLDWINIDWKKRIPFRVNSNQVLPIGGQLKFETLISIQDNVLKNTTINQFRFSKGLVENAPELGYEIEFYDPVTGTLVAWVITDSLKDGDVINLYFDNTNVTPPTDDSNGANVWKLSNNVVAVYHMNQNTYGADSTKDSTGLHDGTPQGDLIAVSGGKIDGSLNFDDAPASFIKIPDDSALDPGTGPWTVTNWVFRRTSGSQILIAKEVGSVGWSVMMRNNDQWFLRFQDASSNIIRRNSADAIIANLDTHLVGTYDGNQDANGIKLYKNGVIDNSNIDGNTPISNISVAALCTIAGGQSGFSRIEDGDLSETRIYNTELTADKIKTIYNNENNPTDPLGFFTQGAVELLTPPANWFNTDFKRRILLTIINGQVTGTLTDYPFLFNSLVSDLEGNAQSLGEDIRFVSEDGTTEFKVEVQEIDTTVGNGKLIAWTKIPSIQDGTKFYMYYNNPTAPTPDPQIAKDVWSDYITVDHMVGQPSGPTLIDSRGIHTSTNFGTIDAPGKIGRARNFIAANNDYVGKTNFEIPGKVVTLQVWMKPSVLSGSHNVLGKSHDASHVPPFHKWVLFQNGSSLTFRVDVNFTLALSILQTNTFHKIDGVYDGVNAETMSIYVDGIFQTLVSRTADIQTGGQEVRIGQNDSSSNESYDGIIDEARTLNVARSAGFLLTEFNNQTIGTGITNTFYTLRLAEMIN